MDQFLTNLQQAGEATWGDITGDVNSQGDLQTVLATKQALLSGTSGSISTAPAGHLIPSNDGNIDIGINSSSGRFRHGYFSGKIWCNNFDVNSNALIHGQLIGGGTTTSDNAAAGVIGEYASTSVTTFVNAPGATTNWADMTSLTLTAGDWDINLMTTLKLNGSVLTSFDIGINQTAGNSSSGLIEGDNWLQSAALPVGAVHQGVGISGYRASLATTVILFGKLNCTYSAGNPQYQCRLSARRVR